MQVVPVYYCTFTVASILGGALVYDELAQVLATRIAVRWPRACREDCHA